MKSIKSDMSPGSESKLGKKKLQQHKMTYVHSRDNTSGLLMTILSVFGVVEFE